MPNLHSQLFASGYLHTIRLCDGSRISLVVRRVAFGNFTTTAGLQGSKDKSSAVDYSLSCGQDVHCAAKVRRLSLSNVFRVTVERGHCSIMSACLKGPNLATIATESKASVRSATARRLLGAGGQHRRQRKHRSKAQSWNGPNEDGGASDVFRWCCVTVL